VAPVRLGSRSSGRPTETLLWVAPEVSGACAGRGGEGRSVEVPWIRGSKRQSCMRQFWKWQPRPSPRVAIVSTLVAVLSVAGGAPSARGAATCRVTIPNGSPLPPGGGTSYKMDRSPSTSRGHDGFVGAEEVDGALTAVFAGDLEIEAVGSTLPHRRPRSARTRRVSTSVALLPYRPLVAGRSRAEPAPTASRSCSSCSLRVSHFQPRPWSRLRRRGFRSVWPY